VDEGDLLQVVGEAGGSGVALRAERPKPVDWKQAAQEALIEEDRRWNARLNQSVKKRMAFLVFFEEQYPWDQRKKQKWLQNSMKRYKEAYKINWGPTSWT
jgi:hypothetical protein